MVVRNVVYVIQRNHSPYVYCFTRLVLRIVEFNSNLQPPTSITNLFKNWLHEIDEITTHEFVWLVVLYYGLFEIVGMTWFLTKMDMLIICRLFTRLRAGSIYGIFFFRRGSGSQWIWMQPTVDGCTGYVQQAWLTAF